MRLPSAVIVLGGPGSGKGTQCAMISNKYNFLHLSAGELLRKEKLKENSTDRLIIDKCMKEAKIVPSQITIRLLLAEIKANGQDKVLIDGFPRDMQNLEKWSRNSKGIITTALVLHLKCDQKLLMERILQRAKEGNRTDDQASIIQKRFRGYEKQTLKVVQELAKNGIVEDVQASGQRENIFVEIEKILKKRSLI